MKGVGRSRSARSHSSATLFLCSAGRGEAAGGGAPARALCQAVEDDWGLKHDEAEQMLEWAALLHELGLSLALTGYHKISAFLVEKGMEGFRLGQKWVDKLGMRASFTAELVFDGVRVPGENLMGEEGQG